MKTSTARTLLGLLIILIGLFLPKIQEWIPESSPNVPTPTILVDEPTEEIKNKTLKISESVTDDKDRLNLSVFNKIFSDRVLMYDSDVQQLNDVYTESGRILFNDSLKGKHEGYGAGVVGLISDITGNENHKLTQEEKIKISDVFSGLAWNLSR